jgi:hypothetical protein
LDNWRQAAALRTVLRLRQQHRAQDPLAVRLESHLPPNVLNVLVPTSRGGNEEAAGDERAAGGEGGRADVTVAHTAERGPGDVTLWGGALGEYTDLWSWRNGVTGGTEGYAVEATDSGVGVKQREDADALLDPDTLQITTVHRTHFLSTLVSLAISAMTCRSALFISFCVLLTDCRQIMSN